MRGAWEVHAHSPPPALEGLVVAPQMQGVRPGEILYDRASVSHSVGCHDADGTVVVGG